MYNIISTLRNSYSFLHFWLTGSLHFSIDLQKISRVFSTQVNNFKILVNDFVIFCNCQFFCETYFILWSFFVYRSSCHLRIKWSEHLWGERNRGIPTLTFLPLRSNPWRKLDIGGCPLSRVRPSCKKPRPSVEINLKK